MASCGRPLAASVSIWVFMSGPDRDESRPGDQVGECVSMDARGQKNKGDQVVK